MKMDFQTKAAKFMCAQTEEDVQETIALFTDKQKDMMLKVLLKYFRGETCIPEKGSERITADK